MRNQSVFVAAGVFAVSAGIAAPAFAQQLDQYLEPHAWGLGQHIIATFPFDAFRGGQTFTNGLSGELSRIEVHVEVSGPPTVPITLDVRPLLPNGLPDMGAGTSMGSVSLVPGAGGTQWLNFDLSALDIQVAAGQQMAFVLSSTHNGFGGDVGNYWLTHYQQVQWAPAIYTGGVGLGYELQDWGGDVAFRTYVTVPAPGAAAILGLGGLAALRRRRR